MFYHTLRKFPLVLLTSLLKGKAHPKTDHEHPEEE